MRVGIAGTGAVSPAGWGAVALAAAYESGTPLALEQRERTEREGSPSRVRAVPKPEIKRPFLRDPRRRRISPIGRFVAAAALEARGEG
ncbi:MAG: hypothetical protein ACR2RV_27905, partial [Verrucomicrobiales bacterium]